MSHILEYVRLNVGHIYEQWRLQTQASDLRASGGDATAYAERKRSVTAKLCYEYLREPCYVEDDGPDGIPRLRVEASGPHTGGLYTKGLQERLEVLLAETDEDLDVEREGSMQSLRKVKSHMRDVLGTSHDISTHLDEEDRKRMRRIILSHGSLSRDDPWQDHFEVMLTATSSLEDDTVHKHRHRKNAAPGATRSVLSREDWLALCGRCELDIDRILKALQAEGCRRHAEEALGQALTVLEKPPELNHLTHLLLAEGACEKEADARAVSSAMLHEGNLESMEAALSPGERLELEGLTRVSFRLRDAARVLVMISKRASEIVELERKAHHPSEGEPTTEAEVTPELMPTLNPSPNPQPQSST